MSDFAKNPAAKSWLIIDPRLNVACPGNEYLSSGGKKLKKWTAAGKRVAWHGGSCGPSWYPPNGEYKTVFAKAPLVLSPF